MRQWTLWQEAPPEAQVALDAATEGLATRPDHPGYTWAISVLKNEPPPYRPEGPEPGITWDELARAQGDTTLAPSRYHEPHTGMVFAHVPPGTFYQGATRRTGERNSDTSAHTSEEPVHQVTLTRSFFLGRTPVTVAQYRVFLDETGYPEPKNPLPEFLNHTPHHPIVCISWLDAHAFTDWLTQTTGHPYRLPSEAQWEWTARSHDGRRYPWGRRHPGREFIHPDARYPQPVAQKPANQGPFGHLDMLGNIQELCEDPWTEYRPEPATDPLEPDESWRQHPSEAPRVARGCAINTPLANQRLTARSPIRPHHFFPWLGFRVWTQEKPPPQ